MWVSVALGSACPTHRHSLWASKRSSGRVAAQRSRLIRFKCAINVAWLDLGYVTAPSVPLPWASVEAMQAQYFTNPMTAAEVELEVGILMSDIGKGHFGKKVAVQHVIG